MMMMMMMMYLRQATGQAPEIAEDSVVPGQVKKIHAPIKPDWADAPQASNWHNFSTEYK